MSCFIHHEPDPFQPPLCRHDAGNWSRILPRCGGQPIGYFAPHCKPIPPSWPRLPASSQPEAA